MKELTGILLQVKTRQTNNTWNNSLYLYVKLCKFLLFTWTHSDHKSIPFHCVFWGITITALFHARWTRKRGCVFHNSSKFPPKPLANNHRREEKWSSSTISWWCNLYWPNYWVKVYSWNKHVINWGSAQIGILMRWDIYSFQIVMGDGWSVGSQMQRVLVVNSIHY